MAPILSRSAARSTSPSTRSAQVAALARGAAQLLDGGGPWRALAAEIHGRLEALAGDLAGLEPFAAARVHGVRAMRALAAGDLGGFLVGHFEALRCFEASQDLRSAALARTNLGFGAAQLGDYARAETELVAALAAAERMGLHTVAGFAHANLGAVLARAGRFADARAATSRAVAAGAREKNPKLTASARVDLAQLALLEGHPADAEREAQAALELLSATSPIRAAALATLARAWIAGGRAADALGAAREAVALLESLGGLDEGEAEVRLVLADALAAAGHAAEAAEALATARAHLLTRAERIVDPAWRESFLTRVPEHGRTMA